MKLFYEKFLKRSPLNYLLTKVLCCIDPSVAKAPEKIPKRLVMRLVETKIVSDSIADQAVILKINLQNDIKCYIHSKFRGEICLLSKAITNPYVPS